MENIKASITENIQDPAFLESLYRKNKSMFAKAFNELYPEFSNEKIAQVWNERLNHEEEKVQWINKREILFILISSMIVAMILKIPQFKKMNEEIFYSRNIAVSIIPLIAIFFLWKRNASFKHWSIPAGLFLLSALYINLLPQTMNSDSIMLACIHLPLFLWMVTGFSFLGKEFKNLSWRMQYLKFNGDLAVTSAILMLSGVIFSGITIGLFSIINKDIVKFYGDYIMVWGAVGIPVLGTFIAFTHPKIVNRISPLIAKIFTPIVLIMSTVFLIAMLTSGKNPYSDREALMMFNFLLIGVMAIIFFSIGEATKQIGKKSSIIVLFLLAIITSVINIIALSAITFRIFEFGLTPNRVAVMGGNILIFINLLIVAFNLYKSMKNTMALNLVENSIAKYLPMYGAWTAFVTFILPLLFHFK